MQGPSQSPSKPSSVACLPCRSRHLKCDAQMPACTRCRTTMTECQYVRSKRGLKKHYQSTPPDSDENAFSVADEDLEWLNTALPELDADTSKAFLQPFDEPVLHDIPIPEDNVIAIPDPEAVTPDVAYDPMIQLYYQNFHPSHPIMVPRKALNSSLCYLIPPQLLSVIRYIGAHFYPDSSFKQRYRQAAFALLSDQSMQDSFRVQALLLLAVVEHSHSYEQSAHRLIEEAVNLSLEAGMHHLRFAREHSYGHSVLEESWRRTYWELYVVEGLLAAMREQSSFRLYHQGASVHLPCAERMYDRDSIVPSGQTLQDLQNNWTLGQTFSTFAYRISAVQTLGTVLELNQSLESGLDSHVETLDAHLTSSLMNLPPLHDDGYDASSQDEMVFQTQMTLYLALIYLHHPRSSLRFASFNTNPPTSCTQIQPSQSSTSTSTSTSTSSSQAKLSNTPSQPHSHSHSQSQPQPQTPSPSPSLDLHSHKLLRATNSLSTLATLPSPIHRRTPFFTCALAMCIIVHTAALLVSTDNTKRDAIRARIQLGFGGLKVLGRVWPLAERVRGRMGGMWREVVGGT